MTPRLEPLDVELASSESLEDAFGRVIDAYRNDDWRPFDPRRAYATSPARDFAWYFTVNDASDPGGRTQHIFFVATSPWETAQTRAFLLSYLVLPGAPVTELGRPWFHFHSAEPVPYAVEFLFSNTLAGALEAAVLTELGTERWEASQMDRLVTAVGALLDRFGLQRPADGPSVCPTLADTLYLNLERPPADARDDVFGRRFVPEGTLAVIGTLVGESIREVIGEAVIWEDDSNFVYPRLRLSGGNGGILRPIPMMIEFYLDDADPLPSEYCTRMIAQLAERLRE